MTVPADPTPAPDEPRVLNADDLGYVRRLAEEKSGGFGRLVARLVDEHLALLAADAAAPRPIDRASRLERLHEAVEMLSDEALRDPETWALDRALADHVWTLLKRHEVAGPQPSEASASDALAAAPGPTPAETDEAVAWAITGPGVTPDNHGVLPVYVSHEAAAEHAGGDAVVKPLYARPAPGGRAVTDDDRVARSTFDRVKGERDAAEAKLARLARRVDAARARGHRTLPIEVVTDVLEGTAP